MDMAFSNSAWTSGEYRAGDPSRKRRLGTGERIDTLREQTLGSLVEVKGSIDTIHNHLVPRVAALEAKAARENRDVLEVLRERLGLHAPLRRSAP
jgi:hypothetical protein